MPAFLSTPFLTAISSTRPLAGRCALVTGAARRIGQGIALALAAAGADVAITYRNSSAEAEETVERLRTADVRTAAFACNLDEPEAITAAINAVGAWATEGTEGCNGLDLLVNNAGAFETAALDEVSVEQWDAMFRTNTRAPMLVAQAALPWLRATAKAHGQAARLVNLGSLGGMRPWATHAHYCASKAALHMLTQTMAKAWAPEIAVNCIAPGMIVTSSESATENSSESAIGTAAGTSAGTAIGTGSDAYEHFVGKTPMARNGRVADVAELVVYLAMATPFLTGQILAVDGGLGL
jgi:NAD(P)-dependent dehydrogenase (short-subunit alcohol dehydrogenase family)